MKNNLYFIVVILITILNINSFVKSDELQCLKNILNKLFLVPGGSVTMCDNNLIDGASFQYQSYCISNQVYYLFIRSKVDSINLADTTALDYSDLNCFTDLQDLELTKVKIKKDAFGTNSDKQVAARLFLYNNTYVDGGLLSTAGNSISSGTTLMRMLLNSGSNLLSLDLKQIKYLKDFILEYNDLPVNNYPSIYNSISTSDSGLVNFHSISMTVKEIVSFTGVKSEYLSLNLINSAMISNYYLLDTLDQIEKLNIFFDQDIDYPLALGSSSNVGIKELTIGGQMYIDSVNIGKLKAPPTGGVSLPPFLQSLTIAKSPDFNLNGNLPFISLPSTLTFFSINNIGLKYFPTLPIDIETIQISSNNFSLFGPISLPDLSMYKKLYFLYLIDCGYTGIIPDSYCIYNAFVNDNDLSGSWPQCMVCYKEEYDDHFDGNSKLSMGSCEKGSIQPNNLVYDQSTGKLELTGKNLGIYGPSIKDTEIQFQITTIQSSYSAIWDSVKYGTLQDTIQIYFGLNVFTVATKVLTPRINSITKSGNLYTFNGLNFSYNKSDIKILASGIQGTINYIDFNSIQVVFNSTLLLPLGQDIGASIQNIKSTQVIPFTINTIQDKTTILQSCNTTCNEALNYGRCSSTTGKCVCTTAYYSGEKCETISHFLSSASSTTTQGGLVNLYGWFGNENLQFKVEIGDQECKVHFVNSTFSNCTIAAGSGTKPIKITENGISWTGENMFHYTELEYKCPKDCSLNGIQNGQCDKSTGQCRCYSGYGGYDCNSKTTTDTSTSTTSSTGTGGSSSFETPKPTLSPIEIPKSTTKINDTLGYVEISNQQTNYEISILSLVELDVFDNIILEFNLTNKWSTSGTSGNNNIYTFKQTIQETCDITYTIEEVKVERNYDFAGLQLSLDKGSIKITVKIENYPFTSALNKLQLRMESSANENNNTGETLNNQCNNKETEIDTGGLDKDQLLNYITISKNEKILYGRFINRVLSDTRQSFITTTLVSNVSSNIDKKDSFIIGLNLPHFTSSLTIDPDFSVLTSSSFKKCNPDGTISERASWVLPVAIVIPCVAVAAIVITASIIYKRNRTKILLTKEKFSVSFKSLSKKNKDELYLS